MTTPASTIPVSTPAEAAWTLPYRGTVGILCLILAESSIFIIFVVAYIYYMGKSLSGPTPRQVLELPILGTVCLLSSSITVHWSVSSLRKHNSRNCALGLAATILLGAIFLATTANEWYHLIHDYGLTIRTNLFGTTFYSLVGLHATHVVIGLIMLTIALIVSLRGHMSQHHEQRLDVLSYYWHFVDAVWVVVFSVVYVFGR